MLRALLVVPVCIWGVGCQCRPDPSLPSDVTDTATPPPTDDTAPPPPCAQPESEPNNALAEADPLALEEEACGDFQAANDADRWRFVLERPEWVSLTVDAQEDGSFANPHLIVAGPGLVADRLDGDETADARLHLPLPAGPYDLQVREQGGGGAPEGWFYRLEVSVQKAPLDWEQTEVEPNDTVAQALPSGVRVFGTLDPADQDLFVVPLPEGRTTLIAAIEAFAFGSPVDAVLSLEDPSGAPLSCGASNPDCRFERGQVGFETDPWLSQSLEGLPSVHLRVRNTSPTQGGSAYWYVLHTELSP